MRLGRGEPYKGPLATLGLLFSLSRCLLFSPGDPKPDRLQQTNSDKLLIPTGDSQTNYLEGRAPLMHT